MNNAMKKERKHFVSGAALNLFLFVISITCIYPIFWMFASSLKTDNEFLANVFSLPSTPQWENYYLALIKSKVLNYFFNTLFNGVTSVLVILFFAFCIAYFLARFHFKGKALVEVILMAGMVVPVHSLLVPMYIQFQLFGLVDQRGALILPYLGVMLPLSVFLMRAYIKGIPTALEESAAIEGASLSSTLVRIIVPVAKPVIITVAIIVFNFVWNELPFAMILNPSEKVRNISVGIMNFSSSYDVKWTLRIAACCVSLVPVILLYIFFNKHIVQGTVDGALKG